MIRFLVFFFLLVVFLTSTAATNIRGSRCSEPVSVTADYSDYFTVGSTDVRALDISFEPDATGSETVAVIGLQFCSRESADSCNDYNFDTDADGLGDTNLLDASSIEKSGVRGISGFRYLRVYASTNPSGTDEPEFTICRRLE